MALPVLLTIGALTAGYVALSKSRAEMPGSADPSAPVLASQSNADGTVGVQQAVASAGPVVVGDNNVAAPVGQTFVTAPVGVPGTYANVNSDGVELSMGGTDPSCEASAPAIQVPTTHPTAGASDGRHVPAQRVNPHISTASLYYGSENGLSRAQRAKALAEVGPLAGLVW